MSNNNLTPNQEQIYLFIRQYISQNKHAPYLREIQQSCNVKSHKTVIDRLTALERKGYIKRKISQHRSIKLIKNKDVVVINHK